MLEDCNKIDTSQNKADFPELPSEQDIIQATAQILAGYYLNLIDIRKVYEPNSRMHQICSDKINKVKEELI